MRPTPLPPEPLIRMGILNTVGYLLERNEEIGEDMAADTEERLFDVPIRMLTDINQQVPRLAFPPTRCLIWDAYN